MKAIFASMLAVLIGTMSALADPAMWEARDADSRIVLFGSVHMLPPDVSWRTDLLEEAIARSEQVYFETDIGPRGVLALAVKMAVATFGATSTPWLHLLTDEQRIRLVESLGPIGLTIEDAGRMPPWMLSMQLASQQLTGEGTAGADYRFTAGVEWTLQWDLVPDLKAFLETPGEQFDLLAGGSIEQQVEGLVATVNETAASETLDAIVDAWAAGDVDTIAHAMTPKSEAERAGLQLLLLDRNRNWLPELERLLAENHEDLVVVGAAHLAGEGSVLDLLEQAGYTVTRIQ